MLISVFLENPIEIFRRRKKALRFFLGWLRETLVATFQFQLLSLSTEKSSNIVGSGKVERSLLPRIHGRAKNENRQAKANYQKERRHSDEENQ